jgi:hypothetical protein
LRDVHGVGFSWLNDHGLLRRRGLCSTFSWSRSRLRWLGLDLLLMGLDLLLRSTLEGSRLHRAVSHRLDRPHNVLGLIVVGFAKRRGPRQVVVHRLEHRRKLAQGLDTRVPRLRIHLRRQLIMWKFLIVLKPFVRGDNLVRVGRCGQDPGE